MHPLHPCDTLTLTHERTHRLSRLHTHTHMLTFSHSHTNPHAHHIHTQPIIHTCPVTLTPRSLTHSLSLTHTQLTARLPALVPAPTRRQEAPLSTSGAGAAGTGSARLSTRRVHSVSRPTPTILAQETGRTLVPSLALLFTIHLRQDLIFPFQMLPEIVFNSASQLKSKTGST